ncbi:helix-turn-helix domain-containing protein [bacterium]|nr:helix-turn-helix domain-containing protein [bacterium]
MSKKIQPLTYYEIFGLDKGTGTIAIGNRYKKLKEIYTSSHSLMRGLMSEKELFIYNQLLDQIIKVMNETELRKEYDMELTERLSSLKTSFPDTFDIADIVRRYDKHLQKNVKKVVHQDVFGREALVEPPLVKVDKEMLQSMVDNMENVEIGGEQLQAIREASGISAQLLCDKTRISRFVLLCIEDENYKDLPAATYVRGFLNSICRTLKLDSSFRDKILKDYIGRMKRVNNKGIVTDTETNHE